MRRRLPREGEATVTNSQSDLTVSVSVETLARKLPDFDEAAAQDARARQNQLTKPPGSLGRLEEFAEFIAGWQGRSRPDIEKSQALVFAGNHGVCAQAVNPFPQAVTAADGGEFCGRWGGDQSAVRAERGGPKSCLLWSWTGQQTILPAHRR